MGLHLVRFITKKNHCGDAKIAKVCFVGGSGGSVRIENEGLNWKIGKLIGGIVKKYWVF